MIFGDVYLKIEGERGRWEIMIENFFAKLKHDRGIATSYDKGSVNFLGGIYLAVSVIYFIDISIIISLKDRIPILSIC